VKGWIAVRDASNGGLVATIGVLLVLLVQTGFTEGQGDPGSAEMARVDRLIAAEARSLPKPVVSFVRWEAGAFPEVLRAIFMINNRSEFPDELFQSAPGLPPCGVNRMAWRAWVFFVAENRQRLNGFCGGPSDPSLRGVALNGKVGSPAPKGVTLVIVDRQTDRIYESDALLIPEPKGP
jgi:hypothetical protein